MLLRNVHPLCADLLDGKVSAYSDVDEYRVLKAIAQAANARAKQLEEAQFAQSRYVERVRFTSGRLAGRTAVVLKRNPKTYGIRMDDDGSQWKVSHVLVDQAEKVVPEAA